jgi:adenylate kinase
MIIFMGVVGSGKSVQGRKLADVLCLPWLSTGEFLRMLISGQTRKDMLKGKLLEDEQMISLVQKIFSVVDTEHEFILDGFPRTIGQADWLLNQLKYGQLNVSAVIHLVASPEVVKKRLLNRGRPDDNADAIEVRLKEYDRTILPVLDELKKNQVNVYDIDAEKSVEEVHAEILNAVKANIANDTKHQD